MDVPREFADRLAADQDLSVAFQGLTPGRQREYIHHFSGAKKAETRLRRIEKFVPKILAGQGMREGDQRKPLPKLGVGEVRLLSGGNPQIPKADGDAPVQAYLHAVPGWKQRVARDLDALIVAVVPDVRKAVRWNSPQASDRPSGPACTPGWISERCLKHHVAPQLHRQLAHMATSELGAAIPDSGHRLGWVQVVIAHGSVTAS